MTIRNKEIYMSCLWDWGFLDKCFTRGIKVTDIDGLVEAGKGHFLLIEAKSSRASIPFGQAMAFNALMETGFFKILIIWGEPNKPEKYCFWEEDKTIKKGAETEKQSIKICDEAEIKFLVSSWFEYAESHPRNI